MPVHVPRLAPYMVVVSNDPAFERGDLVEFDYDAHGFPTPVAVKRPGTWKRRWRRFVLWSCRL